MVLNCRFNLSRLETNKAMKELKPAGVGDVGQKEFTPEKPVRPERPPTFFCFLTDTVYVCV